jgi:penicillin-binding protein 1C
LHEGRPSKAPVQPAGVIVSHVAFEANREAPRDELFLAGTEQSRQRDSAQLAPQRAFGITSPRDGSRYALDPDIPPAAQSIRFEGEHGTWVLDGRRLGQGASLAWAPWPGRHELSLIGPGGRVLQTVRFEVRGAVVRSVAVRRGSDL